MKKTVKSILLVVLATMLCFAFMACSKVGGIYVYEKTEVSGEGAEEYLETMEEALKNIQYKFEDGKFSSSTDSGANWVEYGTYEIDGKTITFKDTDGNAISTSIMGECTIKGSKLEFKVVQGDMTFTSVFKKK